MLNLLAFLVVDRGWILEIFFGFKINYCFKTNSVGLFADTLDFPPEVYVWNEEELNISMIIYRINQIIDINLQWK